ncbi:hypothetical protein O181_102741 [Austropuccinia psidii MF-1]|uniref:Uncharacterized protein n=1 Tax=Austropuccinia psidii MF-1 TaxID=1389203 RepID=A0A9Q3JJA8_9BASI|nr:hypothetical protein [Austropuccinia psidii MF-1]
MEATIHSNQMDVDKEEARPNPEVSDLPQERHIWRMTELPPFPKSSQRREVGNMPKPLAGGHELLLTHQELSGSGEDHRALRRNSTTLTEAKHSVKGSLTPFLGENPICAKEIPKLEEWLTFSGEGEYNDIEFIRTIDMRKEDFHIPDEIIVGNLHSVFTRTVKKWYHKMRQYHGIHDWSWRESEIITKQANNSWRFKMENAFASAVFNSEKDKPLTWFFKQKDILSALHPDMSDTMINMKKSRKCGGELEHAIRCRCVEPCSAEY